MQSTVNVFQTPGIPGDFFDDSANFTHGAIVTSGGVVGNAVTYVNAATDPQQVQGGGSAAFAGIIVNGKELVRSSGLSAGLAVENNSIVPVCNHGNVWVRVNMAVNVGYTPVFNTSTGAIGGYDATSSGASVPEGTAVIPNAAFVITNATSNGMAVLRLKN